MWYNFGVKRFENPAASPEVYWLIPCWSEMKEESI